MQEMRKQWKQQRRENRRKKRIAHAKERQLSTRNEFGMLDLTPYEAINGMIEDQNNDKKVKLDEGERIERTLSG